LEVKST